MEWHEEPIAARHDRRRFRSGAAELDVYLARYARQNHESGGALTFVAVPEPGSDQILGYYSIAPGAVAHADVPPSVTRGLGRYPVPVFRLGRLAVDERIQGEGLGGDLLLAAAKRALAAASQAGGVALAIDAIDERAADWYARFGAVPLLDDPLHLILPLATIATALELDRST
ncbi:MAG: GNAT family N-acetyltransferase [Chloroflexi bacterium]|nr:GNAT family N-acetyltransferase [Chloroflexota bacterium]MDA1240528.1 GNAT family N-acetyltransferase [Chloroflexota bacterium]MQC19308.1 GNAT family N-acetyltransferase [Chloroflexota bacterium]